MHIVQLYYLFLLAGTILGVVFVGGVVVVVIVVVAVVVAVAALFPLFLCNHAQDHLAYLEQKMRNIINKIGEIQTQSKRKYISTSSLSATTNGLQWPQIFLEDIVKQIQK